MDKIIKVALLKETKTPPDRRVALSPKQALEFTKKFPNTKLYVQSSDIRAFKDEEYWALGLNVVDDISECDVLIGVKEVLISELMDNKTYLFFSHTAKEQEHNRALLQAMLKQNITMLDYEYFTDEQGARLAAFGPWAGLVGSYNGLLAFGKRNNLFSLKPANQCHDMQEVFSELKKANLPAIKIVITGGGRVAHGAMKVLEKAGVQKISPEEFLNKNATFDYPVYAQLDPEYYVERKDGTAFELKHFFNNPSMYKSVFKPYTKTADMYIACHFWDEDAPAFFTKEDAKEADFSIQVIADISCDVGIPVPSTIRASTIAAPLYGYDPLKEKESEAFDENAITVMAVDNLPGEVPRDAAKDFGNKLMEHVFPALFDNDPTGIIERACITKNGKLGKHFQYLKKFAENK